MYRFGIAMATHNPNIEFFDQQLKSIQEQTFDGWLCIIGDDSTDHQAALHIQRAVINDARFHYFRNDTTLGVIGNFEAIIAELIPTCEYIVLCDQDDTWIPHRLSFVDAYIHCLQKSRSTPVWFINSNMSLIDANGRTTCASMWNKERRLVRYDHYLSYLFANTATGCGAIVASDLIRSVALPFPRSRHGQAPLILHDGWLAMCAAALGPIDLIWEPLVAYRQHGHNTIGLRKDFQTSLQNLLHQIRDPAGCFYTAKMLLPILQELAKRMPDRVEKQYNLRSLKVVCKGLWVALRHRSWSLPEWYTAFIGMTLYMRIYYLSTGVKTADLRR